MGLPQRDGIIGDRNDGERGDREGQAESQQAIAKKGGGRFMRKAWPDEQSGEKKEHRHEEAVGGENDAVKADPRLGIGVTEIGVGNNRVVEQHHERQECARAIDRGVTRGGFGRRPNICGRRMGKGCHVSPRQGGRVECCSHRGDSARRIIARRAGIRTAARVATAAGTSSIVRS